VTAPVTWRWKTSWLAHEVRGTMASSSALKRWATWRIPSAMRLLQPLQAILGRRNDLDQTRGVLGVAPRGHHSRLPPGVARDEGDGSMVSPLSQPAGPPSEATAADEIKTAHVGPAQLQLLRQALVVCAGSAEIAHNFGAQLLPQLERDHCLDT